MEAMRGSCLCGGIAYEIDKLDSPIEHCSCNTCRKAHAAAFNTAAAVRHEHFRWLKGESLLSGYESSPGKVRRFCSRCGTHLVADREGQDYLMLRVATLDEDPGERPAFQIGASHEPAWLQRAPDLPCYPKWEPGHGSSLVFVYGTLKEGFPNFSINVGKRVAGDFRTVQAYPFYLVGERYSPWMLNQAGEGKQITGQVFEVDASALAAMDTLERAAEPDGYRRVIVKVIRQGAGGQEALDVFAYLKNPAELSVSDIREGPLREYSLEHAALYKKRAR